MCDHENRILIKLPLKNFLVQYEVEENIVLKKKNFALSGKKSRSDGKAKVKTYLPVLKSGKKSNVKDQE